jgi:hypothetical protein
VIQANCLGGSRFYALSLVSVHNLFVLEGAWWGGGESFFRYIRFAVGMVRGDHALKVAYPELFGIARVTPRSHIRKR